MVMMMRHDGAHDDELTTPMARSLLTTLRDLMQHHQNAFAETRACAIILLLLLQIPVLRPHSLKLGVTQEQLLLQIPVLRPHSLKLGVTQEQLLLQIPVLRPHSLKLDVTRDMSPSIAIPLVSRHAALHRHPSRHAAFHRHPSRHAAFH
jgi:hypothetical protein